MGKAIFIVFYSWQSSIGGRANREYIRDKINKAFSAINTELELLEDSRGSVGAPDIPDAILTKIAKSDLFICDVTPVCTMSLEDGKQRAIPNPNVMFELGFAVRCLGWERIVCVCNEEYGSIEHLPFDISKHRIIGYKEAEGGQSSKSLTLVGSLSGIVNHYDEIVAKGNEFDYKKHDIDIFNKMMSFVSEQEFINGICSFKSSGRYYKWDVKCWEYIQDFQDYPENKFISKDLNDCFTKLRMALDELDTLTCQITAGYNMEKWLCEEPGSEYTKEQLREIWMTQEYRKREIPYPDKSGDDAVRKYYDTINKDEQDIIRCSNKVLNTYKVFREQVKRELVI